MKRLEITQATGQLANYVRQLGEEPLAITDGDQVLAVLVSTPNSDWESVSLSMNPRFLAIIQQSRLLQERDDSLSLEEVREQLGITETDLDAARRAIQEMADEESVRPIRPLQ